MRRWEVGVNVRVRESVSLWDLEGTGGDTEGSWTRVRMHEDA